MPTVLILDTSSSMNIPLADCAVTPLQLACNGLNAFLEYVSANAKLEFISIVTYSGDFEVVSPFTRDIELLKLKIMQLNLSETFDVKCIFEGLESFVSEEWGEGISFNIIIITQDRFALEACGIPLTKISGNVLICSMGPEIVTPEYIPKTESYNYLAEFYQADQLNSPASVQQMFISIAERYYSTWIGQLICGNFTSKVTLSPSPQPYYSATDFDSCTYTVENVLEICGFIQLQQLGSPGSVSRHLVLPYSSPIHSSFGRGSGHSKASSSNHPMTSSTDSDDESQDDGQTPSFCVLLHGALKVEVMAALCYVGNDWYGVLFSWADSKKKSNLMLSLLEPGSIDAAPWIGDLNKLTISPTPQAEPGFGKTTEKKSYTQNCVSWIMQQGLQSDIQKILRHSRKLPEKTPQFYKELNRVRRAAIGFGFMSLIDGLAAVLERECTLLPGSAHPACALQLTHAAGVLREPQSRDHKYNIVPMKTSFQPDGGF